MKIYCTNKKVNEIPKEYNFCLDLSDKTQINYTFWDKKIKFFQQYSSTAIDLLMMSVFVFAADKLVSRSDQKDSWTREITLDIPVSSPSFWNNEKANLIQMLNFLSGDRWQFIFRPKHYFEEQNYFQSMNNKNIEIKNYSTICMLSGGLDSYIGAIDLLESKNKNILFVSHYGGGKGAKNNQDKLFEILKNNYHLNSSDYQQFYAICKNSVESSTRTRSFLFFSHAVALASAMKGPVNIIIPENGFISLNIPLTQSRFGSSSTRTTHPFYMKYFKTIVNDINPNISINNPYQFFTKGEMIKNCKNQSLLKRTYSFSLSCSHPDIGRYKKLQKPMHCGYCIPCIIRQAAIKFGFGYDDTEYRDIPINSSNIKRINYNAYNIFIKQYENFSPYLAIQESGMIEDNIEEIANMFKRGLSEIKEFIINSNQQEINRTDVGIEQQDSIQDF